MRQEPSGPVARSTKVQHSTFTSPSRERAGERRSATMGRKRAQSGARKPSPPLRQDAPLPPLPRHRTLLRGARARGPVTADAPSFGEVRLHLRAARALHLIGPSAGASVNHAGLPAWLSLRADRTAAVVVGGGVVAAHWRVDHDADAVTLAGDVLILTVRAPVDAHSDVKEERAFVLTFTEPADAREARDALRATEPSRGKRATDHDSLDNDDRAMAKKRVFAAAAPLHDPSNAFDAKIAEDSAAEYFRYYASIPQQQNMLQDRVAPARTSPP